VRWQERQLRQAPRPGCRALLLRQQHRLRLASSRTVRISLLTGGVMPLRLRLHRQRLASGRTVWRSRLASRVRVSLLPSRPPRRRKHGTLPRFAASRRRSCCLPRRRRRWTRLCGRSSQRHPPTPPTLPTSHLSSLPLQPLLPPTPFAAAAGAAAASQWSSRAGLGRAGPDVFRPSRAGCGPAGPGRAGFCSQRRRSCIATPTGGAADGLRMRPRRSETRARAPLRKAE
jgi:hypothetical protein